MRTHYSGPTSCFPDALLDAGIDSSILKNSPTIPEVEAIAKRHEIQFSCKKGAFALNEEPVIVIYDNQNGTLHAVYHPSPSEIYSNRPISAILWNLHNWRE